jgi:ubiquinone/menaquinone biosynthesis C-methylase UbiE
MNSDLITYYKNRAKEYERIYDKSERQDDLLKASKELQAIFAGKNVLEIACGTGYWTEKIAKTAGSVLATDINESVISIARQKHFSKDNVKFLVRDLYELNLDEKAGSVFGGFIWSHIPLQDIDGFLNKIIALVMEGGTVVFMDNNYVEGSNHPISDTDVHGNTYQTRNLEDGTAHRVLKNFPTREFLVNKLKNKAEETDFINLEYYWILVFKINR